MNTKLARPIIEVRSGKYEPSKAELEEDVSIDTTPEGLAARALKHIAFNLRHIPRP